MKGPSLHGSPMKQDKSKKVKARATGPRFAGKKVNLFKTAGTTTNPPKYFKLVDGKKNSISAEEYKSLGGS